MVHFLKEIALFFFLFLEHHYTVHPSFWPLGMAIFVRKCELKLFRMTKTDLPNHNLYTSYPHLTWKNLYLLICSGDEEFTEKSC